MEHSDLTNALLNDDHNKCSEHPSSNISTKLMQKYIFSPCDENSQHLLSWRFHIQPAAVVQLLSRV